MDLLDTPGNRFSLQGIDPETVLSGEELVRRFVEEFDAEEVLEDELADPNEGEVKG